MENGSETAKNATDSLTSICENITYLIARGFISPTQLNVFNSGIAILSSFFEFLGWPISFPALNEKYFTSKRFVKDCKKVIRLILPIKTTMFDESFLAEWIKQINMSPSGFADCSFYLRMNGGALSDTTKESQKSVIQKRDAIINKIRDEYGLDIGSIHILQGIFLLMWCEKFHFVSRDKSGSLLRITI